MPPIPYYHNSILLFSLARGALGVRPAAGAGECGRTLSKQIYLCGRPSKRMMCADANRGWGTPSLPSVISRDLTARASCDWSGEQFS